MAVSLFCTGTPLLSSRWNLFKISSVKWGCCRHLCYRNSPQTASNCKFPDNDLFVTPQEVTELIILCCKSLWLNPEGDFLFFFFTRWEHSCSYCWKLRGNSSNSFNIFFSRDFWILMFIKQGRGLERVVLLLKQSPLFLTLLLLSPPVDGFLPCPSRRGTHIKTLPTKSKRYVTDLCIQWESQVQTTQMTWVWFHDNTHADKTTLYSNLCILKQPYTLICVIGNSSIL